MIFQAISLQLQSIYPLIIATVHYGLPLVLLYFLGKHRSSSNEKMENERRELTDKLHKISQQVPGVIYQFRLNPDGSSCFPYASDAIKEIYRVTPQEVQHNADKIFAILHFEDFERISRSIIESAKNLTPWSEEYRVKFDDGTIRWLHGNALPQREADGSTLWHGFITDITDKKRIEVDYKSVIDASFDGFFSVDFSGRILSVNQAFCDILGYSEDELFNININDIDVCEKQEDTAKHIRQIVQTGRDQFETKHRCKNGTIIDVAISTVFLQALGQRLFVFIKDITIQKQLYARVRESEFRWKFAIEGSGDGLWDWNISQNTVFFSKRWKDMIGFAEDELENTFDAWEIRIHPDDKEKVFSTLQDYFAEKIPVYLVEHRLQCKDGCYKWILARGMIVNRDENHKPIRMIGTHTDISTHKALEQELRASEIRLQEIIDLMPIAVFVKDTQSRVTLMNKACETQWGVSFEQMRNKTGAEFYPPEQMAVFLEIDRQVFETKDVVEVEEYVLNAKTLENRLTHTYKKPVFNEVGEPEYIIAISTDITEIKQQQEALKASEAYLRTIVDVLPVPLALKNSRDGTITFLNRIFIETFGYQLNDIFTLQQWWEKFYPDETYRQKIVDIWEITRERAHQETTAAIPFDVVVCCKNGTEKTVLISTVIISETVNLVALLDISDRKKIEQELQRSNADLEQFAYAVSHDMRQPLRMVTSYLGLIENALQTQLDEETQTFLNFAIEGAKRMDSMILSLLDYSRVGRKTEPVTLISSRACLDEALFFLNPNLTGATIEISGDWIDLSASHDEITRLLQNLISNALKYHEENKPPQIKICASVIQNYFRIEVQDNGIGIEPNQMERLFKVFSRLQARSRFEGTGVGLALCRRIVEHHNGKIGVYSDGEGYGCTFWFELPLGETTKQELNDAIENI